MNHRRRVRTTSVVGGGAAIMITIGTVTALIHFAGWAGDRYRARHRANRQE